MERKISECNQNVFKSKFSEVSLAEEVQHDIATNRFKIMMDEHTFFSLFIFFLFDFALLLLLFFFLRGKQ